MNHGKNQMQSRLIKTIIIGKASVGKSSLILRYADKKNRHTHTTVGIDILLKKICHKGSNYALQLWDTAGHERYRTVVYNYFFHSQAAIVVFDLSDQNSLDQAKTWLQQITLHCGESIPKVLVGNKSDLFQKDGIANILEGYKYKIENIKKQYNCDFYTVSAFTGQNLEQVFISLLEKAIKVQDSTKLAKSIKLKSSLLRVQRREGCC